ncbi:hypothetical protein WAI453_008836 [Rhynchosporium graminicola]
MISCLTTVKVYLTQCADTSPHLTRSSPSAGQERRGDGWDARKLKLCLSSPRLPSSLSLIIALYENRFPILIARRGG